MSICPVIPRIAPGAAVELFLPADPVNPGRIGVWSPSGGHAEADLDYYFRSRRPRNLAGIEACDRIVDAYRAWMRSIPADDRQTVVVVSRRTAAHRRTASASF